MGEAVKENFGYKHAKSSWMSAAESFRLVEHLGEIGTRDGNLDAFMMDGSYANYVYELGAPPEGSSYFAACVPMVFSLLNGIELYIKGYEYAAYPERAPKAPPKLPALLETFYASAYPKDEAVVAGIRKYTGEDVPELLKRFLENSGVQVSDLLSTRRYLNNNNFFNVVETFKQFTYTAEEGKAFFAEIAADVSPLLVSAATLQAGIDENGVENDAIAALRLG